MKKKIISISSIWEISRENSIAFSEELGDELEGNEFDSFILCLHFPREIGEYEKELLKSQFNSIVGTALIERFGTKRDFTEPELEIRVDFFKMNYELWFRPVFLFARYGKLERGLPQTRWDCAKCRGKGCGECNGTGKRHAESVQELACIPAEREFDAEGSRFHGAGREDRDARMLGTGRPFVIELLSPKRRMAGLKLLEGKINESAKGKIRVSGLRASDRSELLEVKSGEFQKTYEARVEFGEEIPREKLEKACAELSGKELLQNTPNRVMHRRANLERKRTVIYVKVKEFSGKSALLEIRAEHGTYIKEFVSGDEGRTKPNLSELLGVPAFVSEL
ncbi:MAG: tRNA pseudouridine(54/55) synthase Pus10, partial [archaeon]